MQSRSIFFLLGLIFSLNSNAADLAEEYLVISNWKHTIDHQVENAIKNHLALNPNSNKEKVIHFFNVTSILFNKGYDA